MAVLWVSGEACGLKCGKLKQPVSISAGYLQKICRSRISSSRTEVLVEDSHDFLGSFTGQSVVNSCALSSGLHEPLRTQKRKLLRDGGHPHASPLRQVPNAALPIEHIAQEQEARGGGQHLQKTGRIFSIIFKSFLVHERDNAQIRPKSQAIRYDRC